MRNLLIIFFVTILHSCSSDNENANDSESTDQIVGTWTELGRGDVLDDGTDEFSEYDYFCVTLGRFTFEDDGSFRIETFSETSGIAGDENCTSIGVLTGTWENQGDTYLIVVTTDTSNESEVGTEADIQIEFPTTERMQWIFQVDSNGIDYEYEIYTRVE